MFKYSFFIFLFVLTSQLNASPLEDLPVSYKGRIRTADAYARAWLYDLYHRQQLASNDLVAFKTDSRSALDLLWRLHLHGIAGLEDAPLFYTEKRERLSLRQLKKIPALEEFAIKEDPYEQEARRLQGERNLAAYLEEKWPLKRRLMEAGSSFALLPDRHNLAHWYSLKALKLKIYDPEKQMLVPISNFTAYSDDSFLKIQNIYLEHPENLQELASELHRNYGLIAHETYQEAFGKKLTLPSWWQLKAENIYLQWSLVELSLLLYGLGALALLFSWRANWVLALAFLFHSLTLLLRSSILMRPPVSNMFETILYVPWVGMIAAFLIGSRFSRLAAALTALLLLITLKVTQTAPQMENLQAVLDSQYWLIVHVLLVVGSYGLFFLSGILGHYYLFAYLYYGEEREKMRELSSTLLKTLYIGVAMLIPGTILGGVWAAESWGRFWDWDPKESWAFISACVYLLIIHAYQFRYIGNLTLSLGAIAGLQAIIFTWYGVNYILGTGLHSYGFGTGGEIYYLFLLAIECLAIATGIYFEVKKCKTH